MDLKCLSSKKGFTLVELMVVVAIIGILSAIAVPNFKKYQAKSKTSEAKLQLSAIYTAEISFATDFDTFAACLPSMGYDPTANEANRYYTTGFGDIGGIDYSGLTNCPSPAENERAFVAGRKVGGMVAPVSWLAASGITSDGDTFLATAVGILDPQKKATDTADRWTINQDKLLDNPKVGY